MAKPKKYRIPYAHYYAGEDTSFQHNELCYLEMDRIRNIIQLGDLHRPQVREGYKTYRTQAQFGSKPGYTLHHIPNHVWECAVAPFSAAIATRMRCHPTGFEHTGRNRFENE